MASTSNARWKIESAGVDSGLKIFGLRGESTCTPKHNRAASMNPVSNTTTPAALLTRIRVCSLHLICHACHQNSRPISVDRLRGVTSKVGGQAGWSAEERWTAGRHGIGPRASVQALRGICGTKALDIESTRFTTFTPTGSVCGRDSILAAAQMLTSGFSSGMWVGMESRVVVLTTTRLPGSEQ